MRPLYSFGRYFEIMFGMEGIAPDPNAYIRFWGVAIVSAFFGIVTVHTRKDAHGCQ